MRPFTAATTLAALTALAAFEAASCTGLSNDCELNLTCERQPVMCPPVLESDACNTCAARACCSQVSDCGYDQDCYNSCVYGIWPLPPTCSTGTTGVLFAALNTCLESNCTTECAPADYCNPVTAAGCISGSVCETAYPGVFVCNNGMTMTAQACAMCNPDTFEFCAPGLHCMVSARMCARYCCTDADCGGAAGSCVLDPTVTFGAPLTSPKDKVGLCLDATHAPLCGTMPVMPPSGGTCVGGIP
jgi:hypothetical protein